MEVKEFDVNYWEDVWESIRIPVAVKADEIHEIHHVLSNILPKTELSLIEIGCAPGGWLAYYHNHYKYSVNGIEYAPKAHKITVENLQSQNIPAEIIAGDFFEFEHEPYDIVHSVGFIEHWENAVSVVQRIVDLCAPNGGYVVTMIPSMEGINWWISKTFRPHVAAGHYRMNKAELVKHHEQ